MSDEDRPFLAMQPKDGDSILVCSHIGKGAHTHWMHEQSGFVLTHQDGTRVSAPWIAVCDGCFHQAGGMGTTLDRLSSVLVQVLTWKGNVPAIRAPKGIGDG